MAQPKEWRYGYDLSRETALKSGTLYPILMRLEKRGWLETRWTQAAGVGRPPRHMYRLTSDGLSCARAMMPSKAQRVVRRHAFGAGRG
ncbi:MAG: PadR family transcriptional regulator [Candidatus Acidiferrales bacterium]